MVVARGLALVEMVRKGRIEMSKRTEMKGMEAAVVSECIASGHLLVLS